VSLPQAAGVPGRVSFQIRSFRGVPVRDYIAKQTKELHAYLVRSDLAVFRHLHPTMDSSGTWSAPVTLPLPGDYRMIAEFVARDSGGRGDFLMLGRTARVPGHWSPQRVEPPTVGDDGTINLALKGSGRVGPSGQLVFVARDVHARPVKLGAYLGAFAHITAFHVGSGSVVHMHPLGQPHVEQTGTRLTFHTEFLKSGRYVCFVQVRVDGFLHTLPLGLEVN
jgi:hypothetical protein